MSFIDGNSRIRLRTTGSDSHWDRLVTALDGMFPPGTPIPGATFLDRINDALRADLSALVLVRMSSGQRVLRVVGQLLRNAPNHRERSFDETVSNHAAWDDDPVARRLHDRCRRRPQAHFSYATRRLARKLDGKPSQSLAFLDGMGVCHEITSLMPVGRNLFSLLTLYRTETTSECFSRRERRMLKLLHRTFAPRVMDLRHVSIRESLPHTLYTAFTLLLAGHTEKEIARELHRSHNTIHDHVKRIYTHFGVTSRAQLMARFIDVEKVVKQFSPAAGNGSTTPGEA